MNQKELGRCTLTKGLGSSANPTDPTRNLLFGDKPINSTSSNLARDSNRAKGILPTEHSAVVAELLKLHEDWIGRDLNRQTFQIDWHLHSHFLILFAWNYPNPKIILNYLTYEQTQFALRIWPADLPVDLPSLPSCDFSSDWTSRCLRTSESHRFAGNPWLGDISKPLFPQGEIKVALDLEVPDFILVMIMIALRMKTSLFTQGLAAFPAYVKSLQLKQLR